MIEITISLSDDEFDAACELAVDNDSSIEELVYVTVRKKVIAYRKSVIGQERNREKKRIRRELAKMTKEDRRKNVELRMQLFKNNPLYIFEELGI